MESLASYEQLIEWRFEISKRLLELRKLSTRAKVWSDEGPDHRAYAWNRLVGAGFALWRAIPLIDDVGSESHPRKSAVQVDHGEALLDELIRHNRVTYDQEKGVARYWAAGFYLNDAEDRLISVADRELKEDLVSEVPAIAKVRQNAEGRSKPVHGGRQHRCSDALVALRELTSALALLK